MKKLLLPINCIVVSCLLFACQSTSNKSGINQSDSVVAAGKKDSPVIASDTINTVRIEHGTTDQEKLDSIKKAKAKLKK